MSTLREVMSPNPVTIGREQSLSAALQRMSEHSVRHLPVLHGGKLEGILSLTDVEYIRRLDSRPLEEISVEDAMTQEIYAVDPDAPLRDVVIHMSEHRIGSAVVVEGGKAFGIFTAVDALAVLAKLL